LKKTFIIISLLTSILLIGQEKRLDSIDLNELDNIYIKALKNRFDLLKTTDWKYIRLDENTQRISKLNAPDIYEFLTSEELINISIKERKSIQALVLRHRIIEVNTVDVNFEYIDIQGYTLIEYVYDTDLKNYIPDMRFVFDQKIKSWIFTSGLYKISTE